MAVHYTRMVTGWQRIITMPLQHRKHKQISMA